MTEIKKCKACELVARRDKGMAPVWDCIFRAQFWDVVHCNETALLGWTVIVARRHMGSLDELTQAEAMELGILLRKVSMALKEIVQCAKTYVMQFAESEGFHHVHFHVVPRMADLPEDHRSVKIFKLLGVSEEERVSGESLNEFSLKLRRFLESE
jgi:diadenosine tetraphosphate (Ap4A) HIT family hydrolase